MSITQYLKSKLPRPRMIREGQHEEARKIFAISPELIEDEEEYHLFNNNLITVLKQNCFISKNSLFDYNKSGGPAIGMTVIDPYLMPFPSLDSIDYHCDFSSFGTGTLDALAIDIFDQIMPLLEHSDRIYFVGYKSKIAHIAELSDGKGLVEKIITKRVRLTVVSFQADCNETITCIF